MMIRTHLAIAIAAIILFLPKISNKFVFVFVGGIFSAEDAYKVIRQGATLVGLITGMIFEGPQLISDINLGLVKLLKKDGFNNIQEAIGITARN